MADPTIPSLPSAGDVVEVDSSQDLLQLCNSEEMGDEPLLIISPMPASESPLLESATVPDTGDNLVLGGVHSSAQFDEKAALLMCIGTPEAENKQLRLLNNQIAPNAGSTGDSSSSVNIDVDILVAASTFARDAVVHDSNTGRKRDSCVADSPATSNVAQKRQKTTNSSSQSDEIGAILLPANASTNDAINSTLAFNSVSILPNVAPSDLPGLSLLTESRPSEWKQHDSDVECDAMIQYCDDGKTQQRKRFLVEGLSLDLLLYKIKGLECFRSAELAPAMAKHSDLPVTDVAKNISNLVRRHHKSHACKAGRFFSADGTKVKAKSFPKGSYLVTASVIGALVPRILQQGRKKHRNDLQNPT